MGNQATTEAKNCPLCQGLNRCAQAEGQDAEHCWCTREEFPPRLLEDLAEAGAAWCICKKCLEKAQGVNYAG